jgi:RHS repeat-associated protein
MINSFFSSRGAVNTNLLQYTGRENEGNGLYFYRARYYSPLTGRFINQDPLGFSGSGPNLYAYAGNSPTNFTDPSGLEVTATGPTTTPYVGEPSPAAVDEAVEAAEEQMAKPWGGGARAGWQVSCSCLTDFLHMKTTKLFRISTRKTQLMTRSGNQSPHTIRRCWPIRGLCLWRADTRTETGGPDNPETATKTAINSGRTPEHTAQTC